MSAEVRIDQGAIQRLLRRRGGKAYRQMEERARRVARFAEEEAPGSMGDFVSWDVVVGPKGLQGVVRCNHPAVLFVLKGTRPHIIRPRRRQALHFYVDGTEVFTKLVRHPGTRPNDFMARALRLGR
ncbi:hypothetical protein [Streptomyces sp. NBC_00425]|uniref:hypothetical protein n=1 Tax=Streptomyces sp. NBC_00425 TaxID=2975740 RepID=UPI002E2264F8